MPNTYTEFVRREQKRRGWSNTQLADHAGLSKQVVGDVIKDTREVLRQRPDSKTVAGFSSAFGVPEVVVWQSVVKAMGIPTTSEASLVVELQAASDDDLLRELADRLESRHVASPAKKSLLPEAGGTTFARDQSDT